MKLEIMFYTFENAGCIHCILLGMLEAVEGELCLLEMLDAAKVSVICCLLPCMLKPEECGLYLLEVSEDVGGARDDELCPRYSVYLKALKCSSVSVFRNFCCGSWSRYKSPPCSSNASNRVTSPCKVIFYAG